MANENAIQATGTFITRKGLSLITKLVADKGTLSFSRGVVGVGRPPEGYSPDSMIALSSYKMDAEIADYGVQDDKAFVTLQISSDQVAEGFLLTEVGLYATDPDEGEVLYAYMDISTDPTYIYANGSATRTKFAEFTLYVLIGTVERVTAAVTPGSIITKDTFKADKLPVSDTSGILGEIGKVATGQAMFDALAHKVVEELVTNNDLIATLASYVTTEALTTKLAEYILKNKIVDNFLATSADTVLSGTMGAELKRLLDVLNTNFKNYTVDEIYQIPNINGVSTQPEYIDIGFHNVTRYSNGTRIYSVQVHVYTSAISNSIIGYIDPKFMGTAQDLYGYAVDVKTNTLYLLQILPNGTIMIKTLSGSDIPEQTLHIRGSVVY